MRFGIRHGSFSRAPIALGVLVLVGLIWACGGTESVGTDDSKPVAKQSDVSDRGTVPHPSTLARSSTAVTPDGGEPISGVSESGSGSSDAGVSMMTEPVIPSPGPGEVKTAWQEGLDLFQGKDYEGAATKFEIVARGREEVVDVHYLLGLSLWNSGRHEGAEAAMTRAASLDPDAPRIWTNLARIRLDRGDPAGALQAIEKSLAIDPESAAALHQKGRALFDLDRGDEAIETLSNARSIEPENGYIANTLGWALIQMDRPEEAVRHLEEARDVLPTVAFVRNNLGIAYERLGRTENAYQEYRAAVEAGDPDGKASVSIARVEPFVERILARRGEVLPPPATARGVNGSPSADEAPLPGGETVARNIPEPEEEESAGTGVDAGTTGDPDTEEDSDTQ